MDVKKGGIQSLDLLHNSPFFFSFGLACRSTYWCGEGREEKR
jgi:hypothetical protein